MKIGLMTYQWQDMESLHYLARLTDYSLRGRHELRYCPPQYLQISRDQRMALVKEWVEGCDVLVIPVDEMVLRARSEVVGNKPPSVTFLMGGPSRGGRNVASICQYLRTSDVLIGNCVAEVEQCRALLPDATLRMLPFPVDDTKFYPESPGVIEAAKRYLGVDPRSKIVAYSGRLSLEKNVHTLLKVFSVVQQNVPDSVLVIAGTETNASFGEFGVFALEVTRMLKKLIPALGIDPGRIRFVGQRGPDELRALYNIADLVLNLTLNHDENFGLAQVEAMLCGTPVIGTNWGGLRDTIIEGVTGKKVSALLTRGGVKVNWWQAAQTVVDELRSSADRETVRQKCRTATLERYSLTRYRDDLEQILAECMALKNVEREPVTPSCFATDLWALFTDGDCIPPYRRGPKGLQMYRQLVTPLMGDADNSRPVAVTVSSNQVVCLATPVVERSSGCLDINDPIFPMVVDVPEDLRPIVSRIIQVLQCKSVSRADELLDHPDPAELGNALTWMSEAGIILANTCTAGNWLNSAGGGREEPAFNIVPVDHSVDVLYIH